MSKVWSFIIILSIFVSFLTGKPDVVITSITSNSKSAIENILILAGMLCFWNGIFRILENTTLLDKISVKINKIVLKVFNKKELTDKAKDYIALNVTGNLLGIGNASTINGIKAMEEMSSVNKSDTPSDNMTKFVLLNSASIQLIPTSMIALRSLYGSSNPTNILIPVWIVSSVALIVGLLAINILNKTMR